MLDLLELFPIRFPLLVPLLNSIGYFIKHKTRIPNEIIPFILFVVASACSVGIRLFTTDYSGWYYWFDTVFLYGLVNSLKLTLYAIGGYEAVRAIRFTSRREEVKNNMRGFFRSILGFVAATIIVSMVTVIAGSSFFGVFSHLTDAWGGIIAYAACYSFITNLVKHKERVTSAYIVMVCSIILSDVMFLLASATADRTLCIIGLVAAVVFGIVAGVLAFIPYIKERKAIKEKMLKPFNEDDYKKAWVKVRSKLLNSNKDKKKDILYNFLCFRLLGDSIYNDVDLSKPLFEVKDENGGNVVMPIAKAVSAGISADMIANAQEYVDSLVSASENAVEGK